MYHFIYDIEVYPNVFTFAVKCHETGLSRIFEFSDFKNELSDWYRFMTSLSMSNSSVMVGFNNLSYDYPVIHYVYNTCDKVTPYSIFTRSSEIINAKNKFAFTVWSSDMVVPQLDLYKINHFDNMAKRTSLKVIEFNIGAGWLQELPFEPGKYLNRDEIDALKDYNLNRDVVNTERFFVECLPMIKFRRELSEKYPIDFSNHSDSKIGGDFLLFEILSNKFGKISDQIEFYKFRKRLGSTTRACIDFKEIILPYISFDNEEFSKILEKFKETSVVETKNCLKGFNTVVDGVKYKFGTGGVHACRVDSPTMFRADDTYGIFDVDVTSFYPNIAIRNGFYPEHLGKEFCQAYEKLYTERGKYAKGSDLNMLFKLALNATFGNSNSEYSKFYDPKFTMSITVNGQLLLCMLVDLFRKTLSDYKILQVNTDGVTLLLNRSEKSQMESACVRWCELTGLNLEEVEYSKMLIKDVNNYAAMKIDGKIKLKGKYEFKKPHYKDRSALVIPKAVAAYFEKNIPVDKYIREHDNMMDFMLRAKIPRSSKLFCGQRRIQNVSRYFVSLSGEKLTKIMPPLKKNPNKERAIGLHVGNSVTECNSILDAGKGVLNYAYYIKQAKKLIPE